VYYLLNEGCCYVQGLGKFALFSRHSTDCDVIRGVGKGSSWVDDGDLFYRG